MTLTFEPFEIHAWPLARLTFDSGETATWTPADPDQGGPATAATSFTSATIVGSPDGPADQIVALGVERMDGDRHSVQFYVRRLD